MVTETRIVYGASGIGRLGKSGSISPNTVIAQLVMWGIESATDGWTDTCGICGSAGAQCRPSCQWEPYTVVLSVPQD